MMTVLIIIGVVGIAAGAIGGFIHGANKSLKEMDEGKKYRKL